MSKFKVNDWVLDDEDNLFQVTRVRDDEIALTDEPYYVLAKDFRLWTPKVGDWVTVEGTLPGDKFQLTEKEIEHEEILLAHFRFSRDKWSVWKPQVGEWCWFNMEFLDGWQNPVLMRYGEQDMSRWNIEPFVGNLPNFIKSKTLKD